MIDTINKIASIQKTANNQTKEFNSTLPVTIKVISQSGPLRYLLELGNTKLSTKSLKELEIGSSYWGELNKKTKSSINLSKLIKKPKILQQDFPITIEYDEWEAIRLVDYLNLSQEEAAKKMQISQPTLSRILKAGHNKIAKALVEGKAIMINKL
jgi:predicted DNA-binding protein (UPF0251 family)